MSKNLFKPPKELIKEWPEVFEGLYMNTMPVNYLLLVRLEFSDGRIWEIDVKELLENSTKDIVAEKILDTFSEYAESIERIDFKIDIDQLKKDIINQTKNLIG